MLSKYLKTIMNGGVPEDDRPPLEIGMAAYEAGDIDAALPALLEGLGQVPDHLGALMAMARIYLDRNAPEHALEMLVRAAAIAPKDAQNHYMQGEAKQALDDPAGAEAAFRKVTTLDPDHTDAHIRLGMLLAEQNRLQEAVKAYERAIFLDRTAVVARYNLAQVCVQLEDYQRALAQLHLVKELHPDYAPLHLLQGDLFQRLGDQRQAVIEFNRAIELGSGDAQTHWQLAEAHLSLGERSKALKSYQEVVSLDAGFMPAHAMAARLLEDLKRYPQALDAFRGLLEAPEFAEEAKAAVARLGSIISEMERKMAGRQTGELKGATGQLPPRKPAD